MPGKYPRRYHDKTFTTKRSLTNGSRQILVRVRVRVRLWVGVRVWDRVRG